MPRSAELGDHAEAAARDYLLSHGLELLGEKVRVGRFELDLLFREGPVIVVVEVRTRGPRSWLRALDSVDRGKRARVRSAGERLWRERFARDRSADRMRFDIAAVAFDLAGNAAVEHIRAAF